MTSTTTSLGTRGLSALVTDLDRAALGTAQGSATVDAVADALRPALGDPHLLRPDQRSETRRRTANTCCTSHRTGSFSLVALVRLPGQATPIHDHLAWCVVGFTKAPSTRTRYRHGPTGRWSPRARPCGRRDVDGLMPPGDIHRSQRRRRPRDLAARYGAT